MYSGDGALLSHYLVLILLRLPKKSGLVNNNNNNNNQAHFFTSNSSFTMLLWRMANSQVVIRSVLTLIVAINSLHSIRLVSVFRSNTNTNTDPRFNLRAALTMLNKETAIEEPPSVIVPVVEPLEFVHIPKTGGSAIEYAGSLANQTWGVCHFQAKPLAGPGCHAPSLQYQNLKAALNYSKVGYSWEIWHTPPSWLQHVDSPYSNKTLFAVVRNPYERFLSEFYCPYNGLNPYDWADPNRTFSDPMGISIEEAQEKHYKRRTTKLPETPNALNSFLMERLKYFVKWTAHYIPQSEFIFDQEGNQIVQHVLRFENLREEFDNLMEQYHLPIALDSPVNQRSTNSKYPAKLTVDDLFPETIQRINEVAGKDFEIFGYEKIDAAALATKKKSANTVQRIYYINLEKNTKRRDIMESWLSRQPIPYERINATVGSTEPGTCIERKQDPQRCRGISGLSMTELDIISNHNVSGLTLVFEDDFIPHSPEELQQNVDRSLKMVPADWDIIRWGCWDTPPDSFDHIINNTVYRTVHQRPHDPVARPFCGGTHAMLWREESVSKLYDVWSQTPYDDIDCRLVTEKLNSYCVSLFVGKLKQPEGEATDIPKNKQSELEEHPVKP